jgi:hypothetical protein
MLQNVITLKIVSSLAGFELQTLGPMASMLTITLPRMKYIGLAEDQPSRWRHYIPPKCWNTAKIIHGTTFQSTTIYMHMAMITSNHRCIF